MDAYKFSIEVVKEAGVMLLELRRKNFTVEIKNNNPRDVVTSVDKEINEFIISKIKKQFPEHNIYSEEGHGTVESSNYKWTIDPIDGTSNFVRGIPHFAICLGLLKDNQPIIGAVYNPITKELFSFEKGKGAFFGNSPMHVSSIENLADSYALLHAGRKPELKDWGGESYRRLLSSTKKTSNLACSSLDTCFLAMGRIEVNIYGTLSTLDIASAIGILQEAGGLVLDEFGNSIKISKKIQKTFMANNKKIKVNIFIMICF